MRFALLILRGKLPQNIESTPENSHFSVRIKRDTTTNHYHHYHHQCCFHSSTFSLNFRNLGNQHHDHHWWSEWWLHISENISAELDHFVLLVLCLYNYNKWWRHQMETFSALLALFRGIQRPPVDSPYKGQWRGTLIFSLVCTWTNGWIALIMTSL